MDYYGVEADDAIDFILSPYFYPTARFIRAALAQGGKSANITLLQHYHVGLYLIVQMSVSSYLGLKLNNPCARSSVCPLSDGCEPLCNTGAGLPDDCGGPEAA